jgi:hypothetical protein
MKCPFKLVNIRFKNSNGFDEFEDDVNQQCEQSACQCWESITGTCGFVTAGYLAAVELRRRNKE